MGKNQYYQHLNEIMHSVPNEDVLNVVKTKTLASNLIILNECAAHGNIELFSLIFKYYKENYGSVINSHSYLEIIKNALGSQSTPIVKICVSEFTEVDKTTDFYYISKQEDVIRKAIGTNNIEIIGLLLANSHFSLSSKKKLDVAISTDSIHFYKQLSNGKKPNNKHLNDAAAAGALHITKYLMEKMSDTDFLKNEGKAIISAATCNRTKVLRVLFDKYANHYQVQALTSVVRNGNIATIKEFVNEIVKEKNETLPSVITYSAQNVFEYFCDHFELDDMLKEMNKIRSKADDVIYKKDVLFRLKMKRDLQTVEDQKTNNNKRKI